MRQVTSEIVNYMNENEIVVNNTNYKLELLNFIAEGVLNDLNKEQFDDLLHEAMTVLLEGENFSVSWQLTQHKKVEKSLDFWSFRGHNIDIL